MDSTLDENQSSNVLRRIARSHDGTAQKRRFWHVRSRFALRSTCIATFQNFVFRYSNRVALGISDGERADLAVKGAAGKRLTYRQAN